MTRSLVVRVADLFAAGPDQVEPAVRRHLRPAMSSRVVATGAGTIVTLETMLRGPLPGRRGRAVADLDAVLTAVHHELDTAVDAPKAVGSSAPHQEMRSSYDHRMLSGSTTSRSGDDADPNGRNVRGWA